MLDGKIFSNLEYSLLCKARLEWKIVHFIVRQCKNDVSWQVLAVAALDHRACQSHTLLASARAARMHRTARETSRAAVATQPAAYRNRESSPVV